MPPYAVAAETVFLGEDLLAWLVLAMGAAMVVANVAALVRPPRADPQRPESERLERPPLRRVVPLVCVGLLVSVWAVASLVS